MTTNIDRCTIQVYWQTPITIDVVALYRERGFTKLPPTLTITGSEIRRLGEVPAEYQLQRLGTDYESIADAEAVIVSDGDKFIGVPPATTHRGSANA